MRNILVISSGIFHPPLLGRTHLWRCLASVPGVKLNHACSVESMTHADPAAIDAVVLYIHCRTSSPSALDALDRFVRGGGGILAIHSATASFKGTPSYADLIGGRFTGHPPVGPMEIRAVHGNDEIFDAVDPFTVTDETYHHELRADVQVHFVAQAALHSTGRAGRLERMFPVGTPIVWTRRHEAGRICYVGAGHRASSLCHDSIQRILRTGLEWVCRASGEILP